MPADKRKMISTGISSLDPIVSGGFQAGTFALLMGELGTGYDEFLITSACNLARLGSQRGAPKGVQCPKEIWWATFMRQPSDIVDEVSDSFSPEFSDVFQKYVKLRDFFPEYAKTAPYLPRKIMDEFTKGKGAHKLPKTFEELGKAGLSPSPLLLESLADFLDKRAPENMVVIHTLTDLVRMYRTSEEEWRSFLLFLHWVQRSVKRWGGVIYTTLMKGFLEPRMEAELLPCFDNILNFERETHGHTQQRVMSINKFKRLALPMEEVAKMQIKVTPRGGFEVERIRLVERLK
ncbi:MAG TPA: hypothetical protein EYP46_00095 [Hadesarchaea archaeon]|nr:hypothetical protein [Hadesarchaea archaeon]